MFKDNDILFIIMNINELPNELLAKILEYILPDKKCNIEEFKNYFLVNKLWYKILNSNSMLITFSNKYNLCNSLKNQKLSYFTLINTLCINNLILKMNPLFLTILTYNSIIKLPFCKFTNSKCIDGLCHLKDSGYCYRNNHCIYNYITYPVMRGIDDLGRIYLLFCYKDLNTNDYHYEFIYHKTIYDESFVTFSGIFNKTYIGMMGENKEYDPDYIYEREINIFSFRYMKKLIYSTKCGIPVYNSVSQTFNESDTEFISLYL